MDPTIPSKNFRDMTDDELRAEWAHWNDKVESATGWGAAYAQAFKWRRAIEGILRERGATLTHRDPASDA